MTARALMIQGTGSDVGKSLIVAGLARLLVRRGLRVRPFKPQNMSNNAAVTADGGEIGRAQALQARAARVAPSVHMNPVLLKPQSEVGAQIVVQGRVFGTARAREFQAIKPTLLPAVLDSFARLKAESDVVLVEGAGSASEVNLRANDIANMGFARAADVPVVLVGDIDRGGVIASLVGTKAVLDPADAALIVGFLVNRMRGDPTLFADGMRFVAARTGWAPLGLVPWFADAAKLPAEDILGLKGSPPGSRAAHASPGEGEALPPSDTPGLALRDAAPDGAAPQGEASATPHPEEARRAVSKASATPHPEEARRAVSKPHPEEARRAVSKDDTNKTIKIAVPVLPRISNFDDLDPLRLEPGVELVLLRDGAPLPVDTDLVILPGSKATLADLAALRTAGWDHDIHAHVRRGGRVLGLCGGYQMLGRTVADPDGFEGPPGAAAGLGLLDVETVLTADKSLLAVTGTGEDGTPFAGYEMHMGRTTGPGTARPLLRLADGRPDGALSPDGRIAGCYVHGLFADDRQRAAWLARLGGEPGALAYEAMVEATLDALADHLAAHLDIERLLSLAR